MNVYTYKMGHDYGFAPNPFDGICTLATCKPKIRMGAQLGDWIIATGSKKLGLKNHLIHLMEVTEKLSFEQYWNDPRFQLKKPKFNGSLARLYGDNVYYLKEDSSYGQVQCLHSNVDGSQNHAHTKRDTKGKFVLISSNFYYFGESHFRIPKEYTSICSNTRDTEKNKNIELAIDGYFGVTVPVISVKPCHFKRSYNYIKKL